MDIGLQAKYPLFLSDFHGNWTSLIDFNKILIQQIHEKTSNVSQVVPCG
jgi:hypothetical protein